MLTITSKIQMDRCRKEINMLTAEQMMNTTYLNTTTERLAAWEDDITRDAANEGRSKENKIDVNDVIDEMKRTDEVYLKLTAYSSAIETRNASIDSELKLLNEEMETFQKEHQSGIENDTSFWCFGG